MRIAACAVLLCVASSGPVLAAGLEIAEEEGAEHLIVKEDEGVWQLYLKGGLVMHAIMIASIAALAFAIERGVKLRQPIQVPGGLVEEAMGRLSRGGPPALNAHMQGKESALASLIVAAHGKITDGKEAMLQAMVDRSAEVLYDLRRNVRPLGVVANVTPLLGLLGTVFGMISAFDSVSAGGLGRGEELAGGIAKALITTGAGLMVAIPALLLYHFYRGRAEDLVRKAETQTLTFVERAIAATASKG